MNANYKYMLIYALVYPIAIGVIMSVGGKNRLLSSRIFSNIILIKIKWPWPKTVSKNQSLNPRKTVDRTQRRVLDHMTPHTPHP